MSRTFGKTHNFSEHRR